MQFCSEFEWISPSGRGLLTHYMPAHYSAGWWMDESATLTEAEQATCRAVRGTEEGRADPQRACCRSAPTTRHRTSGSPRSTATGPSRYTWPRFVCALPREFFAAVRAELDDRGRDAVAADPGHEPDLHRQGRVVSSTPSRPTGPPRTRCWTPRSSRCSPRLVAGADYPQAALAKAWVQLAYGAHHDAITGSESDQVYLDLLTGWRDAWELGRAARDNSLALLSSAVDRRSRGGVEPVGAQPHRHRHRPIRPTRSARTSGCWIATAPCCPRWSSTAAGRSAGWPATCRRWAGGPTGWLPAMLTSGWEPLAGNEIANEHYRLDRRPGPRRRGDVAGPRRQAADRRRPGRQRAGRLRGISGAPDRRRRARGICCPRGRWSARRKRPAQVQAYRSPLGQRLVVRGRIGDLLRYTQTLTLWRGVDRVDCAHHHRRLHRRGPTAAAALAVPGAGCHAGQRSRRRRRRPRFRVAAQRTPAPWIPLSTRGRWTTRPTAGSGCRRRRGSRVGDNRVRAVSVAEVVVADRGGGRSAGARPDGRAGAGRRHGDLQQRRPAALRATSASTPTCPTPGSRSAGQPNVFTKAVLAAADPVYAARARAAAGRDRPGHRCGCPPPTPLAEGLGARRRPAGPRERCRCW